MSRFTYFTHSPCPVCGRKSPDCRESGEGLVFCHERLNDYVCTPGYVYVGLNKDGLWGMWRPEDADDDYQPGRFERREAPEPKPVAKREYAPGRDPFSIKVKRSHPLSASEAFELAESLGLPVSAIKDDWRLLSLADFDNPNAYAWAIPEWGYQDSKLIEVGRHVRYPDGKKRTYGNLDADHKRGLIIPSSFAGSEGPIYVPEGASDTFCLSAMGLAAIGRPSNIGGIDDLEELLKDVPADRKVYIVAENDRKTDGRWPGKEGAEKTAQELANRLDRPIRVVFPPEESKDVRDWYAQHAHREEDVAKAFRFAFGSATIYSKQTQAERLLPAVVDTIVIAAAVMASPAEMLAAWIAKAKADDEAHDRWLTENEPAAAKRIAEMRRDREAYNCTAPRGVQMRSTDTGDPYLFELRCEHRGTCCGCRLYLNDRELVNARLRFGQSPALYECGCNDDQWQGLQKRIRRAKGEYLRCRDGDGWYVVMSQQVTGSIPCTVQTAMSTLETLLADDHGHKRPITTSHGWSLPDAPEQGRFERIGQCPVLTPDRLQEIADTVDAVAIPVTSQKDANEPQGKVIRMWRFAREGGWDESAFGQLTDNLCMNETFDAATYQAWQTTPVAAFAKDDDYSDLPW